YTHGSARIPGERAPGKGSRTARRDHGLVGGYGRKWRPGRWRSRRGGRMRIYEGSPRQDFEEVFRSIGAFLDQRGMKEVLLVEAPDGFIVQGLVSSTGGDSGWSEAMGHQAKETLTFLDDDIARFMDEAVARRKAAESEAAAQAGASTSADWDRAGYY